MTVTEVGVMYVFCYKWFVQSKVVNATMLQYQYKRLYLAKINLFMKILKALPFLRFLQACLQQPLNLIILFH